MQRNQTPPTSRKSYWPSQRVQTIIAVTVVMVFVLIFARDYFGF